VEVEKLCSLLNVVHDTCEGCNWQGAHSSSDWCCWCSVRFDAGDLHNGWEPRKKQEEKTKNVVTTQTDCKFYQICVEKGVTCNNLCYKPTTEA
ncbi:MAG: hypothetical protein FWF27_05225, partial [Candidatus Bathyarchaeota archaeon]|nr:hypothetical protein [Candidatus Termiticorpusculum sp.]